MRNLTVFIKNNKGTVHLDESIFMPETMTLRHATIFWGYNNITIDNNKIVSGTSPNTNEIVFEPGYWDFEMIRERLSSENIILTRNIPDKTCNILSKVNKLNLKNFGEILGFNISQIVNVNVNTKSTKHVDILRGLRYVNVKCDVVDMRESTDSNGNRSTTLSSIPIVSYETLNSSARNYFDINSKVITCSGTIKTLRFAVDSNIKPIVNVDMLLNIVIE